MNFTYRLHATLQRKILQAFYRFQCERRVKAKFDNYGAQELRFLGSSTHFYYVLCSCKVAANVFGLCVRAGFGAQNCQPALNLNRSTKLQVCTSPRLTQNPCYWLAFYSRCYFQIVCSPFQLVYAL